MDVIFIIFILLVFIFVLLLIVIGALCFASFLFIIFLSPINVCVFIGCSAARPLGAAVRWVGIIFVATVLVVADGTTLAIILNLLPSAWSTVFLRVRHIGGRWVEVVVFRIGVASVARSVRRHDRRLLESDYKM